LAVNQAVRVNTRFHAKYGRRHGDFKADNILLDREGVPKLVDFFSPFCRSCDRDQFRESTFSAHPVVQDIRGALAASWHDEARRASALAAAELVIDADEASCNMWLLQELKLLVAGLAGEEVPSPVTLATVSPPGPLLSVRGGELPEGCGWEGSESRGSSRSSSASTRCQAGTGDHVAHLLRTCGVGVDSGKSRHGKQQAESGTCGFAGLF